jgi:Flp pilus assembly protein TadD
MLNSLSAPSPQAQALRRLIAAVKGQAAAALVEQAPLPSEFMAESYRLQARYQLPAALAAARHAAAKSPRFGFAWARVAELEFSFGRTDAALAAVHKSLELSPRNAQARAVQGFLLAAQNKTPAALDAFEQAIRLDSTLGNAWLGRGLCHIRRGDNAAGQADLMVAASLEPNRAVLRSYLGKAFAVQGAAALAEKELALARR